MRKFRKLLSLVLVVCMVCALGTTAWAEEASENPIYDDNFITEEEVAADAAEWQRMYDMGLQKPRVPLYKGLYVDLLLQDDPEWSSISLPCGHAGDTYGKVGCAMTSYAMVVNYYKMSSYTPVDIAETYGTSACDFNSSVLLRDYTLKGVAKSYTNTTAQFNAAKTSIKGAIAQDRPVVIKLKKVEETHFVVANGYEVWDDGSLSVYLRDPESDLAYDTLDEYKSNGWYVQATVAVY